MKEIKTVFIFEKHILFYYRFSQETLRRSSMENEGSFSSMREIPIFPVIHLTFFKLKIPKFILLLPALREQNVWKIKTSLLDIQIPSKRDNF